MSKAKGIIDPWRTVEPIRAPKKDLDDIDRDADLAIPGKYVIRYENVAFDVTSTKIQSPKDAFDILAECVCSLFGNKDLRDALVNADIGARSKLGMWNAPDDTVQSSNITGGNSIIWFIQKNLNQGLYELSQIMRSRTARPIVSSNGIVVMLTSS